jgi:hypothetical protein
MQEGKYTGAINEVVCDGLAQFHVINVAQISFDCKALMIKDCLSLKKKIQSYS